MPTMSRPVLFPHTRQRQVTPLAPNVLDAHAGQAALLVDAAGTIRSATPEAATLLGRTEAELAGLAFGVVPAHPDDVLLDLLGSGGSRRVISARSLTSEMGRNWSVVLLEDASDCQRLQDAVALALTDVAPLLRSRGITTTRAVWPDAMVIPAFRALLAGAIECLIDLTGPTGATLRMNPRVADHYVMIGLDIAGGSRQESDSFTDCFEQTLRRAQAADGFLRLEVGENGLALQLVVPLAQFPASR